MNKVFGVLTLLLFGCGAVEQGNGVENKATEPVATAPATEPETATSETMPTTDKQNTKISKPTNKGLEISKESATDKKQITDKKIANKHSDADGVEQSEDIVLNPHGDEPDGDRDDDQIGDDDQDDDETDDNPPVPAFVEITDLTYAGTGCSAGNATVDYLHDGQTFELNTSDLFAYADQHSARRDRRRFCQVLVAIDHSEGWQFTIKQVQLEAHVEIESGTDAEAKITSYIQGDEETTTEEYTFSGPVFDSFSLAATPTTDLIWSPCDVRRALNMKVEALVKGTTSVDDPLGIIEIGNPVVMELKWRTCSTDQDTPDQ